MPVGELLLSAFLQVLLDRLASRELLNFALHEGVGAKLKKWKKTFKMIQAVLIDAEEKQLVDDAVKMWLDDLQDLAYDAEDILDEFATEALGRKLKAEDQASTSKVRNFIPACCTGLTPGALKFNFSMRSKIDGITSRMEELCKQRVELGLETSTGGTSNAQWKRPDSTCVPKEPAVCGRDEDKFKILELVLRDEPSDANFRVIPIVGMGGLGKTTLAREVYNDVKVVVGFNPRAWTCVSDDFDVLRISKAILESMSPSFRHPENLNEVQVELRKAVSGKKFLLILDDVWSDDYGLWEILKSPFMAGAPGSRIIVTTRSQNVASTMELGKYHYSLKILTDDACWDIFEKHVSGHEVVAAGPNLKLIREKVVEKCRGLPLAATTLGGLLRCKQRYNEWEDILNSKIWDLPEKNGILSVLRISYYHLPSHLKRCFVYCAIFPKDYEFTEKELVLLWMAQGLIKQSRNKQLEDLGDEYFQYLLSRSILQRSSNNYCKYIMHDLVNDLAQQISRETTFLLDDKLEVNLELEGLERIRHFSYVCREYEVKDKFEVFHRIEHLRTYLPSWSSRFKRIFITNIFYSDLFSKLKKLRVLSLENYCITEIPDSIGGLRHLRYLNLSRTMIKSLPESTSLLCNLQSLLLRGCSHLIKLPSNMMNLINLRHLDIFGAYLIAKMPMGIKKLKFLSTLSNFIVGKGVGSTLKDLKDLKFLHGELSISSLENTTYSQEKKEIILNDKKGLEILVLEWGCDFNPSRDSVAEEIILDMLQPHTNLQELTIKNYGGEKFPSWVGNPSFFNIVVLELDSCENCSTLPSFGLLDSLKELIIKRMNVLNKIGFEIYGMGCSNSFKSLKTLCFEDLPEWEQWDPSEENEHVRRFPCLRELSISQCHKLSGRLPNYLPLLEKLVIEECEQLVVSFSSLPMLCSLEINRCKGMVCSRSKDFMTSGESNFPVFRSWSREGFEKLESLSIIGCEEVIHLWPNEICLEKPQQGSHSFIFLKELYITELPNLISFPDGFLSILSRVEIRECNALKSLHDGLEHNNARIEHLEVYGCPSLRFIVRGRLPSSLQILNVFNCENLVCLLDDREDTCTLSSSSHSLMQTDDVANTSKPLFKGLETYHCPSTLSHLWIENCSNLMTLLSGGQLPNTLKSLGIFFCPKLESVVESFDDNMYLESLLICNCENLRSMPEGLHTLCNLSSICIWACPSLVTFPKDGLPNTDNLSVDIVRCERLQALPSRMHSLKSLRYLHLTKCPSLALFPEQDIPANLTSLDIEGPNIYKALAEWGFNKLTSLINLTIYTCPDAMSFPEVGMKLPTSLVNLTVDGFPKLKYLASKDFRNLTSLERLWVEDCPNLTSLPDLPSSLLQLHIRRCPLLTERCKREEGQDWSKIAHIPCVKIDDKFIYDPEEEQ